MAATKNKNAATARHTISPSPPKEKGTSRKTINSGIMQIRATVNLFGRFTPTSPFFSNRFSDQIVIHTFGNLHSGKLPFPIGALWGPDENLSVNIRCIGPASAIIGL